MADAPFRAARRTGNDPVSLTTLATTVGGFRARIQAAQKWLDAEFPLEGALYARINEAVEAQVKPMLALALTPSESMGAERTKSGEFDPSASTRLQIRLWGVLSRSLLGIRRPLKPFARRAIEKSLPD